MPGSCAQSFKNVAGNFPKAYFGSVGTLQKVPSRRHFIAGTASAAGAALAGCLGESDDLDFSPGTDGDADWPMARYDSANTAYNPDAKAPRDGVSERWRYDGGMVAGIPVVADGTVYLPTGDALVAIDSATGEERWRYVPDDHSRFGSPVVHDGTVYAVSTTGDSVRAVGADSGEEVWSREGVAHTRAGVHLLASEYVDDPVLYTGTENGEVFRLDPETGEVSWSTDLFGTISAFGYRFGAVYVGTYGGEVYAFGDTVDGVDGPTEGWRRKVGSAVETVLPDEEGVLVDTFDGPLRCLQDAARAGKVRWTAGRERAGTAPVDADGTVFAAGYEGASAIRENDGETEWELDGEFHAVDPVAAGDTLYVGDRHSVHALSLGGGLGAGGFRVNAERWSHDFGDAVVQSLVVADGAVFVTCNQGEADLYCLEPN